MKLLSILVFLSCFINNNAFGSGSLEYFCSGFGHLVTNQFIDNINVKEKTDAGEIMATVQLLYHHQWYSVTGPGALSVLYTAELSVLLHHKVDLCVDLTKGQEKVFGIQYSAL